MSEETVIVNFQIQKHYCTCCNQKLPEVKTSKLQEFTISKENSLNWTDWNSIAEYQEDELEELVREFVYETINFYATISYEKLIIEDSEILKVRDYIMREIVGKDNVSNV